MTAATMIAVMMLFMILRSLSRSAGGRDLVSACRPRRSKRSLERPQPHPGEASYGRCPVRRSAPRVNPPSSSPPGRTPTGNGSAQMLEGGALRGRFLEDPPTSTGPSIVARTATVTRKRQKVTQP
jgi:hypothetical protein